MPRYLFTYSGRGDIPAEHVEQINRTGRIVDRTLSSLLVDVEADRVQPLAQSLPGWNVEKEQTVPLPDTRKRIQKPVAEP